MLILSNRSKCIHCQVPKHIASPHFISIDVHNRSELGSDTNKYASHFMQLLHFKCLFEELHLIWSFRIGVTVSRFPSREVVVHPVWRKHTHFVVPCLIIINDVVTEMEQRRIILQRIVANRLNSTSIANLNDTKNGSIGPHFPRARDRHLKRFGR